MPEYTYFQLPQQVRELNLNIVRDVLAQQDITLKTRPDAHVTLRPSVPWVKDRGWLNFIGNWHYFAQPPGDNASWVQAIAPSSAGKLEVWIADLTPGSTYLVAIDVMSMVGGPNPAFNVGASDAAHAVVSASPPDQVLLTVIKPAMTMSLVTVEPLDLQAWIFFAAHVYKLD
ncbi:MAG: hypothetical protein ACJ789_19760 [Thermomicrobiales bacterium]